MAWTTPRQWNYGDTLTADRLNAISDNLEYLYKSPVKVWNTASVTHAITTSWAVLTDMKLEYEVTQGRGVLIGLRIPYVSCDTAIRNVYFDIRINGTSYLSTLGNTPSTNGSYLNLYTLAGETTPVRFLSYWKTPPKGRHTFEVMAKVSSTAVVVAYTAGSEFLVMEV